MLSTHQFPAQSPIRSTNAGDGVFLVAQNQSPYVFNEKFQFLVVGVGGGSGGVGNLGKHLPEVHPYEVPFPEGVFLAYQE